MDDVNADRGPNPETGDAGVESDRLRPITRLLPRLAGRSNARWPAGLVLATIAVLAASGLAFGAQMLPALQTTWTRTRSASSWAVRRKRSPASSSVPCGP